MGWKDDRRAAYLEKLKDPRWQKKRLEVFNRDGFQCQNCESTTATLNVHHWYYDRGKEPWDYPLDALVTLCEECHKEETELWPQEADMLLTVLKRKRFDAGQVNDLATTISEAIDGRDGEIVRAVTFVLWHAETRELVRKMASEFRSGRRVKRVEDTGE